MVLKLLDGGGGGGGDDGFDPSAAEHKRHEQIGNLAVELKHQRLASKPSAMLASWGCRRRLIWSLAAEHKRRASRSATSPASSSTTQCIRRHNINLKCGPPNRLPCFRCELKYVCMHPEQRYTLTRVKNCGYWEPLDDPSTRKSNGKRSTTIINASSFF
uniref:Uncharacterized protein n=1 Tax=Oryza glumipatula TaxID=40148 RepID=A0A0E0AQR2_9ORYZ